MGRRRPNISVQCDYATPDKATCVELHMELPIPHEDLSVIQTWLGHGDWASAERYLLARYPQYSTLLTHWLAASRTRSEAGPEYLAEMA